MARAIRPKNWSEFQHYKDRSPLWIKLHKRLLDNQEFNQLDAFACKVLVLFWLVASETPEGWVVYDPRRISFRMRLSTVEVDDALDRLLEGGFIEADSAAEFVAGERETAQKVRERNGFSSRYINDQVKREVWERDGGHCVFCSATEDIEYDHIIPVSKNGSSDTVNVQLLCRPCNRKKRASTPAEQVATPAQPTPEQPEPRDREQVTRDKIETEAKTEKKRASARSISEPLPDWLPLQAWDSFVEMRRMIRAPLTNNAIRLCITDLEKLRATGHDPLAVLEQSVKRSWRGLFEIEVKNDRGRTGTQQQGRGTRTAAEHSLAAIKRTEGGDSERGALDAACNPRAAITTSRATSDSGGVHPRDDQARRNLPIPDHDDGGKERPQSGVPRRFEASPALEIIQGVPAISAEYREISPDAWNDFGICEMRRAQ